MKLIQRDPFKKVEKYMNEHYGKMYNDEFKIIDGELAGVFKGHSTFVLKSKRFPDFYTRVSQYENEYITNYIQCLYEYKYRDYIQDIVENVIPVCKVIYKVNFYPVHYSESCTFDEFLHDSESLKKINIIVPDLNRDMNNTINSILSVFKKQNIPVCEISFTQIPNYSDSKELNCLNEWSDYYDLNRKKIKSLIFKIRDYKIDRILEGL